MSEKQHELEIRMTVKEEVTKSLLSLRNALKNVSRETSSMLSPFVSMRRAVLGFSAVWGASFGVMLKSVMSVTEEMQRLDTMSRKMGISADELSRKLYGFSMMTTNMRLGQGQQLSFTQKVKQLAMKTGDFFTETWGANALQARTSEIYSKMWDRSMGTETLAQKYQEAKALATKQLEQERLTRLGKEPQGLELTQTAEDMRKKLAMSEVEYMKKQFADQMALMRAHGVEEQRVKQLEHEQTIRWKQDEQTEINRLLAERARAEGDTISAIEYEQANALFEFKRKWGPDGEAVEAFKRAQDAQLMHSKMTLLGIKNDQEIMIGLMRGTVDSMTSGLSTFFNDAFSGDLKKGKEYFAEFGRSLIKTFSDALAEMAVQWMMFNTGLSNGSGGKTNWLDLALQGISLFAGGTSSMIQGGKGGMMFQTGNQSIGGHSFNTAWGPTFHRGGIIRAHSGLAIDEVPIIAQTGERILSRRQVKQLGGQEGIDGMLQGGGGAPTIIFQLQAIDTQTGAEFLLKHASEIASAVVSEMSRSNQALRGSMRKLGK